MVTTVYILIFLIIISVLVIGYLQISQLKIIENLQQKIFVKYALLYAETIPEFNIKDTDNYYLPEKINKFFDVTTIQKGLSKILIEIPSTIIQITFGLLLLSFYHPIFVLLSLLLFLIIFLLLKQTSKIGLETSLAESNSKYSIVGWLQEIGRVIKTLKHSQNNNLPILRTDIKLLNYISYRTAHFKVLLFQFKSLILFKFFVTGLFISVGTYLMFNQSINIGQFVAVEIVIITVINSVEKLILSLETFYDVITGIYKVDSVLKLEKEKSGSILLNEGIYKIEFKNVAFSYQNNEQAILNNLNFTIPKAGLVCVSGDENSGKTTLLKLIAGLYLNHQGTISFNNILLRNYNHKFLREKIGVFLYPQELFNGTLYENITIGRDITENEIITLIQALEFSDFLTLFNDSFETKILELGKTLPHSTRVKILLLRAFINNPSMLVLKDPITGFDSKTKKSIFKYLIKQANIKPVIVSSTNKLFLSNCDLHILLKNSNSTIIKNNE